MKTKRLLLAALAVLAFGGVAGEGMKGGAGYDLKPAAAEKLGTGTTDANLTTYNHSSASSDTKAGYYNGTTYSGVVIEDTGDSGTWHALQGAPSFDSGVYFTLVLTEIATKQYLTFDFGLTGNNANKGNQMSFDMYGLEGTTSDDSIDGHVSYGYTGSDETEAVDIGYHVSYTSSFYSLTMKNPILSTQVGIDSAPNAWSLHIIGLTTLPTLSVYGYPAGTALKSGGTQNVYEDIDHAADFDTIKSSIKAYDLFGAECTVNVTDTEKAKYNPNKIGAYDVQITASDTYGQTATATLHIVVYDQTKPVIALATGKSLTFNIDHDTLKVADLPSYFTITDNASSKGGTIGTPVYKWDGTVFSADKVFSKTDKGTHTIIVDVKDSSGNEATTSFTATVKDVDAPVLARRDGGDVAAAIKVGLSRTFDLTKASFLSLYKATDAVDGDVSSTLAIVGDFIPTHVGSYTVTIKANDTSSNASTQSIAITVIADIPPVFILGTDLVLTHTNTALNTTQIAAIVTNGILMGKTVVNINSLNTGSYIGNESTVGDYTISYNVDVASSGTAASATVNTKKMAETPTTNIQGSFDLRVLAAEDVAKDDGTKTETHWYDGIVTFFTKTMPEFWQKLGNWFRGVFTKLKFDCFITNEAWDVRFADSVKDSAAASNSEATV